MLSLEIEVTAEVINPDGSIDQTTSGVVSIPLPDGINPDDLNPDDLDLSTLIPRDSGTMEP